MSLSRYVSGGLLAVALAGGAGWWWQHQTTEVWRTELAQLREEQGELAQARKKNEQLRAARVSADDLTRLRNDHAAVTRLRGEIGQLNEEALRRERALASGETKREAVESRAAAPVKPARSLQMEMGPDGEVRAEGATVDVVWLRQKLAGLAAGSAVDIRLKLPPTDKGTLPSGAVTRWSKTVHDLAKELNLKVSGLILPAPAVAPLTSAGKTSTPP